MVSSSRVFPVSPFKAACPGGDLPFTENGRRMCEKGYGVVARIVACYSRHVRATDVC